MPLRSPKMYFCILGFQRLVWWPKCTPASSSSFMVNAAMVPSFRFASDRRAAGPRGPPRFPAVPGDGGGDRSSRSCVVNFDCSGRVLRVQPHVLFREVRGPYGVRAAPEPELDGDGVVGAPHGRL